MDKPDWADERAAELTKLIRAQNWKSGGVLIVDESAATSTLASSLRLARAEGEKAGCSEAFDVARKAIDEAFAASTTLPKSTTGDDHDDKVRG